MASKHLVVDGSNIATEGRSLPSLAQLDEAVQAFLRERPHDTYTVVVDATFGHRIDASEKAIYEEALAANEMITPPAGTIGRGDKFLLEIADRANATVFSNDSFQEFHGEYEWLFDTGRLIGGKPVPQVGWIFTERTPVRGPRSRMASRAAGERRGRVSASSGRARRSPLSDLPVAVPTRPPPRRRLSAVREPASEGASEASTTSEDATPSSEVAAEAAAGSAESRRRRRTPSSPEPVNPPLAFIEFIAEHVPGSIVEGEVVSFTSHGAFVQVGGARCYLALKFMGDPPPKSARDVLARGEVRSFVVQALDAPRRGIDLALPGCEDLPTAKMPELVP
ncbi:MAG TPA: S1 RNA-binding domain-containing protein, partial [Acidimicrobiales bacterium]|nr:S1 RNA-binding domain-containing protein [Acidimicrobiales bacterium]